MDAIKLLEDDHRAVKKLLGELDDTTERAEKTRSELFAKIKGEMLVHEAIEEEIFYPALRDHPKTKDVVLEGFEEHHVVDEILAEMETVPVTDETWAAKAKVMKENIEHHIEEEEGEMFPAAREILSEEELDELGERMAERKAELED
jgi:hemerythrin-like domain-containing protein